MSISEKLTEAMYTISDTVVSAPKEAAAVRAEENAVPVATEPVRAGGREVKEPRHRRVNHRPLQAGDIQESNYNQYFIGKVSKQSNSQVNSYALISKIEKKITGIPGNKQR